MDLSIDQYAEMLSKRRLSRKESPVVPARVAAYLPTIKNAGAVLWDVYGTLLTLTVGDLESTLEKRDTMLQACGRTIREFGLRKFLDGTPSETLLRLYVEEIEKTHRRKKARGVYSPEVRIEQVWLRILKRLEARGYRPDGKPEGVDIALARKVAYFFDDVHQAKALYPNVLETLAAVREMGLRQGIISNAQFYTPIMLNVLLRHAGYEGPNPHSELFERQLTFYSYRLGVSKPNPLAFEQARKRLGSKGIEPSRVIYVGNDVRNDMIPARNVGFRAVLFAGDKESLTLRKDRPDCARFKPDAVINKLPQLLEIIS